MVKILKLKLANAIKCGPKEETFLTETGFEMELLNGMVVRIKEKTSGQVTHTTLFNTIYWMADEPVEEVPLAGPVKAKVAAK